MKLIASILFLPISAVAQWFDITATEIDARFRESKTVLILHWNADANDYLVEHIKGEAQLSKMPGQPSTWADAVGAALKEKPFVLVFLGGEQFDGTYIGRRWFTPSIPTSFRNDAVATSDAIKMLRQKK